MIYIIRVFPGYTLLAEFVFPKINANFVMGHMYHMGL